MVVAAATERVTEDRAAEVRAAEDRLDCREATGFFAAARLLEGLRADEARGLAFFLLDFFAAAVALLAVFFALTRALLGAVLLLAFLATAFLPAAFFAVPFLATAFFFVAAVLLSAFFGLLADLATVDFLLVEAFDPLAGLVAVVFAREELVFLVDAARAVLFVFFLEAICVRHHDMISRSAMGPP